MTKLIGGATCSRAVALSPKRSRDKAPRLARMSGTTGEPAEFAPAEMFDEIVVQVTDDRAFVFGDHSNKSRRRWGKWLSLTGAEVTNVLRALDPAVRAVIDVKRLTGGLVELDPVSRELWRRGFEGVTEAGGWMQSTLRDNGQFLRVMRIRPATTLSALAGPVAALAAVAAQVQAAEMARDLREIRQGVDSISKHLQDQQVGEVNAAVDQVNDLVDMIRRHGRDGVETGTFAVLKDRVRTSATRCAQYLQTAIVDMEAAGPQRSPLRAERHLREGSVERALLNLSQLGRLHSATVQLGLAQAALSLSEGKVEVAKSHVETASQTADSIRVSIEDALGRIESLDAQLRSLFDPERGSWVHPALEKGVLLANTFSANKSIPVPGTSIRIPSVLVSTGIAVATNAYVSVDALRQSRAESMLDKQLMQLTRTSAGIRESADADRRHFGMVHDLAEELLGPTGR